MKLLVYKNEITYEDVEPLDFPIVYNTGIIAERFLHTRYNTILQYYFTELLFEAINANIGECHCFDDLTEEERLNKPCRPDCTAIPSLENVITYINDRVVERRELVYSKFKDLIKLIQLGCDNSCKTFELPIIENLVIPTMPCPCLNTALDHVLPADNIPAIVEHIFNITEYLDFFYETNPIIEDRLYFEQIKAINEQNIDLFPLEINVSGYYSDADGAEGTYYLDKEDTTSIDDTGIIYINKGHRYKRRIKDEVHIAYFGAGVGGDDTMLLARILPYTTIFFSYRVYNLYLDRSIEIPVVDCIKWYGDNAVVNIYLADDLNYIFGLRLLQNIYSIRFSGIVFNVIGNARSLFAISDDFFNVELFLFECKVNNAELGFDAVEYHTPSDTTCNSYLEFEKLPYIPDIDGEVDGNTLCNLKYTNSLTSEDNFVKTGNYQEITGAKTFTNELKTNSDAGIALVKGDIAQEHIQTITTSLLENAKKYYEGMSIYSTMPVNSYYMQVVDLGYWDENFAYDPTHDGLTKEIFNEWQTPQKLFPGTKWERVAVTSDHFLASYNKKQTILNSSGLVNDVIKYDVDNSRVDGIKNDNGPAHMGNEYRPRSRKCIIWKRIK